MTTLMANLGTIKDSMIREHGLAPDHDSIWLRDVYEYLWYSLTLTQQTEIVNAVVAKHLNAIAKQVTNKF